jgi:xanthine dehydrogenase YagS FAD-binding subunit
VKQIQHFDAATVQDAVSILSKNKGNAAVISGGTDLLGLMKDKVLPNLPGVLVNIKKIPSISAISEQSGVLTIGAAATLSDIASNSIITSKYPMLAQAANLVAAPAIRNMGTIAGNLRQGTRCWYYRAMNNYFNCLRKGGTTCYAVSGDNRLHGVLGGAGCYMAHPSDMAPALVAMGASVSIAGPSGNRTIKLQDMYQSLGDTVAQDEMITAVTVPTPGAGMKGVYLKFRFRKSIEFPVVSVAALLTVSGGNVTNATIAMGGVTTTPFRASAAESSIVGKAINATNAAAAGAAGVQSFVPMTMTKYKVAIAQTLIGNAILACAT